MVCPRRVIDSVFRAVIDAFKLKIWAMAKLDEIASDDDVFEFGGEPCRHEPMLLSCSGGIPSSSVLAVTSATNGIIASSFPLPVNTDNPDQG